MSVTWDGGAPVIVDQRLLPGEVVHRRLTDAAETIEAIRTLAVRGAPAIGIAGAYGLVAALDAASLASSSGDTLRALVGDLADRIAAARPTAVNLAHDVGRVREAALAAADRGPAAVREAALTEALAIHAADRASCAAIAHHGRMALAGRRRILTHCNTGRLATGGDGTALAVVYALHAAGELDEVLACEARPLLQGGRLTAWELVMAGVPSRVIVDGAAGAAMAAGLVEAVIVGADRIAANGDTANKIGTYALAVLARHHGIPFWVAAPWSTVDPATPDGAAIVVEERDPAEVFGYRDVRWSPAGAGAWNPAFDVTPAELITGIVTDRGTLVAPYGPGIARHARGAEDA